MVGVRRPGYRRRFSPANAVNIFSRHLHAEAVTGGGVRVSHSDVYSNGSVLVVKVNVFNHPVQDANTGTPASNVDLSKRRAAAVVASLVALGVVRDRLTRAAFGDTKPIGTNASDHVSGRCPASASCSKSCRFDAK